MKHKEPKSADTLNSNQLVQPTLQNWNDHKSNEIDEEIKWKITNKQSYRRLYKKTLLKLTENAENNRNRTSSNSV